MKPQMQAEMPRPSWRERLFRAITHSTGLEVMQQFVAPWARMTASLLQETHTLQQAWWKRLQDATEETQEITRSQMQKAAEISLKANEILRDQLQKLSKKGD